MAEKYDFWGWATRNDLKCSDGRTIRHNAFKDCDGKTVPLVWNHQHNDPDNILGHALLKNTEQGVKAYGSFNDDPKSQRVKTSLQHGDITSLSIYANGLKQTPNGDVLHGIIREVSLVLAGANPGASIEYVMAHSDDENQYITGAEIYTGDDLVLEHGDYFVDGIEIVEDPEELSHADKKEDEKEDEKPQKETEEKEEEKAEKAEKDEEQVPEEEPNDDEEKGEEKMPANNEDMTVQDVLDSMTPEQRKVTEYLVGEALAASENVDEEGDEEVKHNAFDADDELMHSAIENEIFDALKDAKRNGSVKESLLAHNLDPEEVLVHGVEHVDYMFPDAQLATGRTIPVMNVNPNGWVNVVMNGIHKTPFAKVKSILADIRADDARAKGYVKGSQKKEEVFKLLKRVVNPVTIYKKQSIDRDDMIDLEEGNIDFISMVKEEMKVKWDEELARAILFADGREVIDDDKIPEDNIIPVIYDTAQNVYAMLSEVTPAEGQPEADAVIDAAVVGMENYEGSGNVTAFLSASIVTQMTLMKDKFGHRLYKTLEEIASAMQVNKIVKVPATIVPEGYYGVMLDLQDYNVGANKAGERSLFDDFDIDYNKQKYLLEGRRSGGLIKPHSAVVLKAASNNSTPEEPIDDNDGE